MAGKAKRKPKMKAAAGNGVMVLIKELWQAAVRLRGSIEPADYKRYVLPLIFLRFLSLRFERRRADLTRRVNEPGDELYTKNPKIIRAILNDEDEYRSVGAFLVPEKASWEYLRARARADDIKVVLDEALDLLEKAYPKQLKGLLPPIYAGSNLDNESVAGLITLFSKDVFEADHGDEDLVGRVYEYFIGEFANSEGKRGGEYFTPISIVRTLVALLQPRSGIVLDPCCGSGGMFVQSDVFTNHSRQLAFYGQESKDFTYRLCRMNLFIHGLDGSIQLGNSYFEDKHSTLKADYILANPPFNDGSKGDKGWGADRITDNDPRLVVNGSRLQLSDRNANTMWILHFLSHLKDGGTAGFVMSTGEASTVESPRYSVRRALIEADYVDCVIALSGKLFANTQIPCCLWFISKNRDGGRDGFRKRRGEVLFLDGRRLGALIPGSRKQKQLSDDEVTRIASVYSQFCHVGAPKEVPGFCRVARTEEIVENDCVLTPNVYTGSEDDEEDGYQPLEEVLPAIKTSLSQQLLRIVECGEAAGLIARGLGPERSVRNPSTPPVERGLLQSLELFSRKVFWSWFVECEPVTAKGAGRSPVGMDDTLAALFPREFEESASGPIPRGWSVRSIANLARYVNGRNFTQGASGSGRMVVRIAELNSGPGNSTVYSNATVDEENLAHPGDLLFAWSGSLDVYRWLRDDALINQHIFKVICEEFPRWFVYYHLKEAMPAFRDIAAGKATTMGHIKRGHLSDYRVVVPPMPLLEEASRYFQPIWDMGLSIAREMHSTPGHSAAKASAAPAGR